MMIESAHRLIAGEREPDGVAQIRSAHVETIGQDMRGSSLRLITTPAAERVLRELPPGIPQPVQLTERRMGPRFIASLRSIGEEGTPSWMNDMTAPGAWTQSCMAVRLPRGFALPPACVEAVRELLEKLELGATADQLLTRGGVSYLLLSDGASEQLLMGFDGHETRRLSKYQTLRIGQGPERRPAEYEVLGAKRVGIVGCGSLGSKIAASLARSGVRAFTLVDDDVILPENLVRNELDWRSVGAQKAEALRERLLEIAPTCDVAVRVVVLGGQESAETAMAALSELAECDLLVDATADPRAFNLAASVARTRRKPMVWAEVFGGGFGGIVARARPGADPPPQAARRQILAWCDERGVAPPPPPRVPYGGAAEDPGPLIADDAEVSVMAAHASRFSTDCLARPDRSLFPYSAFAVGLAEKWIFAGPFDAWPIGYRAEGLWGETVEENASEKAMALLQELLLSNAPPDADSSAR
jgi:sulfur-carrier protein adenylyltransferase/sulfurtransferase